MGGVEPIRKRTRPALSPPSPIIPDHDTSAFFDPAPHPGEMELETTETQRATYIRGAARGDWLGSANVAALLRDFARLEVALASAIEVEREAGLRHSGEAIIERDHIVIRVAISALQMALDNSPILNGLDVSYKITDAPVFASELVRELNHESETGTTSIHELFDAAMSKAIGQGAFGIDEVAHHTPSEGG